MILPNLHKCRKLVLLSSLLFSFAVQPGCSTTSEDEAAEQLVQDLEDDEQTQGQPGDQQESGEEQTSQTQSYDRSDEFEEEGLKAIQQALGEVDAFSDVAGQKNNLVSKSSTRPFPKNTDLFELEKHLISNEQPSEEFISSCKDNLSRLGQKSVNPDSIKISATEFQSTAASDPVSYHWCYLHVIRDLDYVLEKGRYTFVDKMDLFIQHMTKLWIASSALKQITDDDVYVSFTKDRYLHHSKNYFGRDMEQIAPAMSH